MPITTVPSAEFEKRISLVRDKLAETDNDVLCLYTSTDIEWVSGFYHLQTERPVCLAVTDSEIAITVPRLELERAEDESFSMIDQIYHYYDYPGGTSEGYYHHPSATPEETIATMLADLDVDTIAADSPKAPGFWGYSGPKMESYTDVTVEVVDWILEFRKVKSATEIDLMRESAKWGNLAHKKLDEYAEPGKHELWVAKRASLDASMTMLDTLGTTYESHLRGGFPAYCSFLSGPNTALPHGLTENRRLEHGDALITGAISNVAGYLTELERTMFVGDATDDDRHYFAHMLEMQELAISMIKPGQEAAAIDQAVHDYCNEHKLLEYVQHHTGHNMGMEGHERGFLDRGSNEILEVGHVYTIEPGLYIPGVAGYRHSDTVVVTDDGVEELTYYPRDIESNIISY
ncbi:aminopeptidase P family protein [Halorubraceae archaeon YAN]|nr:aminopeptidase P family protein [Halorubraceae archaeon YAN]